MVAVHIFGSLWKCDGDLKVLYAQDPAFLYASRNSAHARARRTDCACVDAGPRSQRSSLPGFCHCVLFVLVCLFSLYKPDKWRRPSHRALAESC